MMMTGFWADVVYAWAPYLDWYGLEQDFALFILCYGLLLMFLAMETYREKSG